MSYAEAEPSATCDETIEAAASKQAPTMLRGICRAYVRQQAPEDYPLRLEEGRPRYSRTQTLQCVERPQDLAAFDVVTKRKWWERNTKRAEE